MGSSRGANICFGVLLELEVHGFGLDGGAQGEPGGLRHGEDVPHGFLARVHNDHFEGAELVYSAHRARLGHAGLEQYPYMALEIPPAAQRTPGNGEGIGHVEADSAGPMGYFLRHLAHPSGEAGVSTEHERDSWAAAGNVHPDLCVQNR
jgi:hypothetical protein